MTKSTSRHAVATQWPVREGEGAALDLTVNHDVNVSGQSLSLLKIDFRTAPVPDRRYAADMCAATYLKHTVRIIFGQQRINSDNYRTLLVISMSEMAIAQFLFSVDQTKDPSFEEIAQGAGIEIEPIGNISEEPEQTVSLSANMVLIAVSGDEASMDFFKASPFSLHAAPHRGKLFLDPVVRVDLTTSALLGLIRALRVFATQFRKSNKQELSNERV